MHFLIAVLMLAAPVRNWQSIRGSAIEARERGNYVEAERLAQSALQMAESTGDSGALSLCLAENGLTYQGMGRLREAAGLFERALKIDEQAGESQAAHAADRLPGSLNNLAAVYAAQGRKQEADAMFSRAIALADTEPLRKAYLVSLLGNRASLLMSSGRAREASEILERALREAEASYGPNAEKTAFIVSNLALSKKALGDYQKAEALNRRALSIREKGAGSRSLVATSWNNLGAVLQLEWRFPEAEAALQRSLEISRAGQQGKFEANYAAALNNLASLYTAEGRTDEAVGPLEEVLGIWKEQFGEKSSPVAMALNNIANNYQVAGQYRQAEPLLLHAAEIWRETPATNPSEYASTLSNLGSVYMKEHKYDKAEALYRQSLRLNQDLLGPAHPTVAKDMANLASVLEARKRYEEAEPLFLKSVELLGDNPDAAGGHLHLAGLYARQGRLPQAAASYRRCIEIWPKLGTGANDPRLIPVLQQYAALERKLANYASAEAAETRAMGIFVTQTIAHGKGDQKRNSFVPGK